MSPEILLSAVLLFRDTTLVPGLLPCSYLDDRWIMGEDKKRREKKRKGEKLWDSKYRCDKKYSNGLVVQHSLLGTYKKNWILFLVVPL